MEEELHQLRQENQLLRELVKQQQDALQEFQQQITHLQEQVRSLQERLKKDSHNSHQPPSSDRFHRQPKSLRKKSDKSLGGQPGHQGRTLMMVEHPDQVIRHSVEVCEHCHRSLMHESPLTSQRRQVIDLPPKRAWVIEHQTESKWCSQCSHLTQSSFPQGVKASIQYGPAFGALGVYLVQQQLLPYERTCELLEDLFGFAVSVATLKKMIEQCSHQLEPVETLVKEALCMAEVLHQDETGMYVAGKRLWAHVSCTAQLTHYSVHPRRGRQALDTIGILAHFDGMSVHDGWKSYQQYGCGHALCNVHHLRELTFLEEECQQDWATGMKTLLLEMKAHVEDAKRSGQTSLPSWLYQQLRQRYHSLVEQGYHAHALDSPFPTYPPQRGRRKQHPALNLLDRLHQQQEAVLAFLYDFAVPFDNSQAERDLRMIKVQQKVSGCFRCFAAAQAFCRIRGYLSTLRKQGFHLLSALEATLQGHPVLPTF